MKRNLKIYNVLLITAMIVGFLSCKDDKEGIDNSFKIETLIVDGGMKYDDVTYSGVKAASPIKLKFSQPVDRNTIAGNIEMIPFDENEDKPGDVPVTISFEDGDHVVTLQPNYELDLFAKYRLNVWEKIYSTQGTLLNTGRSYVITTAIDSTDKKVRIPDDQLLDLVQKQTFKYFWEGGHPTSGMARERNTSGDQVTTGGTGFGIMSMIAATNRNFITRQQAYDRVYKIAKFLRTKCTTYHGAYSHWLNGSTGETMKFSDTDDGADIVETAFLIQGLLTARQYFDQPAESALRDSITNIWKGVDWTWFNKDNAGTLYWNWSPKYAWAVGLPVQGWNEGLITYILAASSPTHAISKEVYIKGWAKSGAMANGKSFYGITLPLGEDYGGPLFFSHFSFLGLNPNGLSDTYANYWEQNKNQSLIHYNYSIENPKRYVGYSNACWGLTASDGDKGYSAFSPTNDLGVIAPTAAISSMPYTPNESMDALRFYYYKLGNYLWKDDGYGFYDSFNLSARWFDNQYLAIDQGPIIVMIENYRTNLLWHYFMKDSEIQKGLTALGFTFKVPDLK